MKSLCQLQKIVLSTLAVLALTGGSALAEEKEKVFAGTIEINSTQLAFMLSGKVGGGVLEFQGEEYYFDLKGLGAGGFGIKKVNAVGAVYNMTNISQFSGFYTQVRVGGALGKKSRGVMSLGNKAGVMIELRDSQSKGLALMSGVDGLTIKLRQ